MNAHRLTQEDANRLYHKIDAQLSPEMLCCDGERSPQEARQTYKMLMGAAKSLDAQFNRPSDLYEL
jgi:hypothetical protein